MGDAEYRELEDVQGQVKWFDSRKGFGFIVGPDGQDIFIHYTRIEGDGFRALKDGAAVRYWAVEGEKGWHATKVLRVEETVDITVRPQTGHARSPRR